MEEWTLIHNPNCTKSKQAHRLLTEKKIKFTTREYLKNPLNADEIKELLTKLNLKPRELVRQKEEAFRENPVDLQDDAALIGLMEKNPALIERPVLIYGNKAMIGRPHEKAIEFVKQMVQ